MEEEKFVINLAEYETLSDLVDERLFWEDKYLYFENSTYIHDANQDKWYSIEPRYGYSDFLWLFNEKLVIEFYEITHDEIIKDLEEEFLN